MEYRCLSLTEPWASLVVLGHKKLETRSWSTRYCGPLLIHTSKTFPKAAKELSFEYPWVLAAEDLGLVNPTQFALGCIIGRVTLEMCLRIPRSLVGLHLSEREVLLGDYTPGRYMWRLAHPIRFERPIPCKGALGIWTVEPALIEQIEVQITQLR